jgi:phosphoribosylformimino-5-aminoimidazole carboxamide ribonucleotide (ProFAR) isomerase
VAGGSVDLNTIRSLRDAAIAGIILGEPLLSGAVDFAKALEAAA